LLLAAILNTLRRYLEICPLPGLQANPWLFEIRHQLPLRGRREQFLPHLGVPALLLFKLALLVDLSLFLDVDYS